ncbi:MAG: hypothetical protein N4A74_25520 [Carboxylicivirga sp.]|jgi:hypothetical protein|nr:hypothetical protein [Carboxylicivirga sp.]
MSDNIINNYGVAWQKTFEGANMPKFNISIDVKKLLNTESENQNQIKLVLRKRDTVDQSNGITHDIVKPGSPKKDDVQISIETEKLKSIPDLKDTVYIEAVAKKNIERDRANYHVRQIVDKESKPVYIGRGWTESQKVEKSYVGNAKRFDFENGGRMYNASFTKEAFDKLKPNDHGNIYLAVAPKKDKTDEFSIYKSVGKDPYSVMTISVNQEQIKNMGDSNGYYQIRILDKQKISKDHADLTVKEDTYAKEKTIAEHKNIPIKEAKLPNNYVGSGWSNVSEHVRLQSSDVTSDGLAKTLAENHAIKAMAIINKDKSIVTDKHVKILDELAGNEKVNINDNLQRLVKYQANNNKQSEGQKV